MHTGHVLTLYGTYLENAQAEFSPQVNVSLNKNYGTWISITCITNSICVILMTFLKQIMHAL